MFLAVLASATLLMTHTQDPLAGVNRIVMMGDSITEQGVSAHGYVTLVASQLKGVEVIGAGIGGQKAPDMLARFQRDAVDRHPQMVTLSVGVNDVWHDFRDPAWTHRVPEGNSGRGVPLPKYIADVTAMIDLAQKNGIRMVLVSPTLIYEDLTCDENKRLLTYVRAEEKIAKAKGCGFVDLNKAFRTAVSGFQKVAGPSHLLLTVDGVHMNDAGNALMADQVLRLLGKALPNHVSP